MPEGLQIASAYINVTAKDDTASGVSAATKTITGQTAKTSAAVKASMSTMFGAVKGVAGSALAPVLDLTEGMAKFGETVEEHGKSASGMLMGIGAAAMAVGGVLMNLGSQETAATNQLKNAITNTGQSFDEFQSQIEDTDSHMAHYGDTAAQTNNAMQTLVIATGDTGTALGDMQIAADMAATSHISLTSAATQLARVTGGSGARILRQYGVQVQYNADGTANWTKTVQVLGERIHGQADAAANTFTGHLHAMGAELENLVAVGGQKFGPWIEGAGLLMLASGATFGSAGRAVGRGVKSFFGFGQAAEAAAVETSTASATIEESLAAEQATLFDLQAADDEATANWLRNASIRAGAAETEAATVTAARTEEGASTMAGGGLGAAGAVEGDAAIASRAGAATTATRGLNGSMAAGIGIIGGVAIAGYALGKSISNWTEKGRIGGKVLSDMNESLPALEQQLDTAGAGFRKITTTWADGQIEADGLGTKVKAAGLSIQGLGKAVTGSDAQFNRFVKLWKLVGHPSNDTLFAAEMMHKQAQQQQEDSKKNAKANEQDSATLTELTTKYHLTSDAAKQYATMSGFVVQKDGSLNGSLKKVGASVDTVKHAYNNANSAGTDWLNALNTFSQSSGTAADRATFLGSTLVAAQGDAISFEDTMATVADTTKQTSQTFAQATKAAKKHGVQLLNLKTDSIDYNKAAAKPLLDAMGQEQQANEDAAKAIYQHRVATEGGKAAAEDAWKFYVTKTKSQLEDEGRQLGLRGQQLQSYVQHYMGLVASPDVKKQISLIGGEPMKKLLKDIENTLLYIAGLRPKTKVEVETQQAQSKLNALLDKIPSGTYSFNVVADYEAHQSQYTDPKSHHATGGYISGAGTGTSDSIPAMLSNGEEVETASATSRNRAALDAANHGATLAIAHFAKGGYVGTQPPAITQKGKSWDYAGSSYTSYKEANKQREQDMRTLGQLLGQIVGKDSIAAVRDLLKSTADLRNDLHTIMSDAKQAVHDGNIPGGQKFLNQLRSDNATMLNEAKKRDQAVNALAKANSNLAAAKKAYADEKSSVKQAFTGAFDIASAGSSGDQSSSSYDRMIATLTDEVQGSKTFATELKHLKAKGLRGDLLRQLAAAGPNSDNALALQHASSAQISHLNKLYGQLGKYGEMAGTTAGNSLTDKQGHKITADIAKYTKDVRDDRRQVARDQERLVKEMAEIRNLLRKRIGPEHGTYHIDNITISPGETRELKRLEDLFKHLPRAARSVGK